MIQLIHHLKNCSLLLVNGISDFSYKTFISLQESFMQLSKDHIPNLHPTDDFESTF
jgi:hypothetical protein